MPIVSRLLVLVCALFTANAALAQEDHITLRAGAFDIGGTYESAHFGLEYRGVPFYHSLLPLAGISGNTDGSFYGYAGLGYDWQFAPSWSLMPSLTAGVYKDDGSNSLDLGGVVEFRSGLELAYICPDNQHRLGLAFYHLSNASLYDQNPGTEILTFNYSVPLN